MISYKIDTVTKHYGEYIAYIHVMDGDKIIQTARLLFTDKEKFKIALEEKTLKIRTEYDDKENKKVEIQAALTEMAKKKEKNHVISPCGNMS